VMEPPYLLRWLYRWSWPCDHGDQQVEVVHVRALWQGRSSGMHALPGHLTEEAAGGDEDGDLSDAESASALLDSEGEFDIDDDEQPNVIAPPVAAAAAAAAAAATPAAAAVAAAQPQTPPMQWAA